MIDNKDYERGFLAGMKAAIETLCESDPLEAICDWEDADDIAQAVKRHAVDCLLRQLPDGCGSSSCSVSRIRGGQLNSGPCRCIRNPK
jgi:hypothetical protein